MEAYTFIENENGTDYVPLSLHTCSQEELGQTGGSSKFYPIAKEFEDDKTIIAPFFKCFDHSQLGLMGNFNKAISTPLILTINIPGEECSNNESEDDLVCVTNNTYERAIR